jgi:hypothetical protein
MDKIRMVHFCLDFFIRSSYFLQISFLLVLPPLQTSPCLRVVAMVGEEPRW